MSVLSDVNLRKIIEGDEGIIILNMREESITAAGYDLSIGFICDSKTGEEPEICKGSEIVGTDINKDMPKYILLPGHTYLVISVEFLYLSGKYMATLHLHSSYALKGLIVTATTIDPNHIGCIAGSLFNCTSDNIYIKKDSLFATMVIHKLSVPTETSIQLNEDGLPSGIQETFHSKFSNVHSKAYQAIDAYYRKISKKIEYKFNTAWKRMVEKKNMEVVTKNKILKEEHPLRATQENSSRKRITFLIGNGFDLNIGLHTGYRDFYLYYIENHKTDKLAEAIQKDFNNWSDLELALGKYIKKVPSKEENKFWDEEIHLENSLVDYLSSQMDRLKLNGEQKQIKIKNEMVKSLTEFYTEYPKPLKEQIKKILSDINNPPNYSFITFNYTDAFDQCLKIAREYFPISFSFDTVEDILHIHGTIQYKDIVLGVNDKSQIENAVFISNFSNRQRLIKEEINTLYKNTNIERARSIIDNSSIICIFGMSIGETDRMWWQYIYNWLKDDRSRILIIFARTKETNKVYKYNNKLIDEIKEKFKSNGEMTDWWEQIENQIYVDVNANMFNFQAV